MSIPIFRIIVTNRIFQHPRLQAFCDKIYRCKYFRIDCFIIAIELITFNGCRTVAIDSKKYRGVRLFCLIAGNMESKISIQPCTSMQDFKELIGLFELVFQMKDFKIPGDEHLMGLLNSKTFYAITVRLEDRIVAGLTFYVLEQYYSSKPLAYIFDLAVLPEFQRQGIGKGLISFTGKFCEERGFQEVFVQADKADEHAVEFYRATRPDEEEQVVNFYYTLRNA